MLTIYNRIESQRDTKKADVLLFEQCNSLIICFNNNNLAFLPIATMQINQHIIYLTHFCLTVQQSLAYKLQ